MGVCRVFSREISGYQGATVRAGKLYQVFGLPGNTCLTCTDLSTGDEVFRSPLNGIPGEPEGLGFHDDRIIVTCGDDNVYRSDLTVKRGMDK